MSSKNYATYWKSIMEEYESSRMKQQQFCKAHNIDFAKFRYQRVRFSAASKVSKTQPKQSNFVPVKLPEQSAPKENIKIIHPNGIECTVPINIDVSTLIQLMRGVKGC